MRQTWEPCFDDGQREMGLLPVFSTSGPGINPLMRYCPETCIFCFSVSLESETRHTNTKGKQIIFASQKRFWTYHV